MLGGDPDAAGAGAAGGTGYGLAAAWGAELVPGAVELARVAGLDRALAGADLVITGEGRFDETSLTGKTCGTVIAAAAAAGVPVAVVAGQVSHGVAAPCAVLTLAGLAGGTGAALASPRRWLRRAGSRLASDMGGKFPGLAGDLPGMGNPPEQRPHGRLEPPWQPLTRTGTRPNSGSATCTRPTSGRSRAMP